MEFSTTDPHSQYLFYFEDIWKFTLWWTMIIFAAIYLTSGIIAAICQRSKVKGIFIILIYLIWGQIQAFISGCIVGSLLAITYKTGSLTMNTWIPCIWGIAQALYVVVSSYSMTSVIL